ncbi:MAG: hypothetical protein ACYTHN_00265, partial [Planctomycetota bacterium]
LFPASAGAQMGMPPLPGGVSDVDWIHVPGISSTGTYSLQWGPASGGNAFELEEDVSPLFPSPTQLYQGTNQSFTVNGRGDGTYYYRVRGINTTYGTQGNFLMADPHVVDSTVGTVPAIPLAPTSVNVPSQMTTTSVIPVSWAPVTGATAYDIQTTSGNISGPTGPALWTLWSLIAVGVQQSPFNHYGINGQQYVFRVRTTIAVGNYTLYSLWSTPSFFCSVMLAVPSGNPSWITVPYTSQTGTYTVNWGAAPNAVTYELEEDTTGTFVNPTQVYSGTAVSFNVSGRGGGFYFYRVRARTIGGTSGWTGASNGCWVTAPAAPNLPPPPFLNVPATSRTGVFLLMWGTSTGATSYDLEEDTTAAFANPTTIYSGAGTGFTVTGKGNGTYYYRVRGVNLQAQGGYTVGANPCLVTLQGELTLGRGGNNFIATEVPGSTDIPVLHLRLSADAVEAVTVSTLTLTEGGSINLSTGILGASLWEDANGDGRQDAGDRLIVAVNAPSGSTISFGGFTETVTPSSSATWLVTYDFSGSVPLGATILPSLLQNGDVTVAGSISATPLVTGAPVTGALKTIGQVGSLALTAGSANPPPTVVPAGTSDVPVLHLQATAGSPEPVTVTLLAITGAGTGDESAEIASAFLYLDDGDGAFDSTLDSLISGPVFFSVDDGKVFFSLNRPIAAGSTEGWFVVYTFASTAAAGADFRAGFAGDGDIQTTGGLTARPVTVSGAPIWGGVHTVTATPTAPPPSNEGGCHGGTSPSGRGAALTWLFMVLAIALLTASLRVYAKSPAP